MNEMYTEAENNIQKEQDIYIKDWQACCTGPNKYFGFGGHMVQVVTTPLCCEDGESCHRPICM
jgi:hypothetical protein